MSVRGSMDSENIDLTGKNGEKAGQLPVPAETVERICRMERYFDAICAAVESAPHVLRGDESMEAMLRSLMSYYENGQWLSDYELDEQGLLPPWLKRGVLSEDGVYDLLSEIEKDGST